ncbi:cation-translocating P-type ATPase [Streptomyces sp. NRRL B-24484]|uniref:cation-translocating P-type ATPase n=1 Tax=Streptomyces sp. NRRL B-24484 TaxID=1463833 RepID=UPI0004C197DF|nr:cation-transporting P-type ATPase [Streptomyces sp. NRRL B-24484]
MTAAVERRRGLTGQQADALLARYGPNEVAPAAGTPLWYRIATQLRDPLILVLLAAAVLTLATGDHADSVVVGLVVVVNTAVGVAQEVRADRAVAALSALCTPRARVVRDGVECEVAATGIVPGDVVLLGEGDVVPADAVVAESSALLLDESVLTGESVPVDKDATHDSGLSAGTVVVRGRAVATVTATGADSTLGRIAVSLHPRPQRTPLQRRLAGLGRVLAAVTLVLCAVVFAVGLVRGQDLETMAVTAISLAVAAVPESLPAVVTLALAIGARRMAARHAVVRRLPAVETLGSVTVLATDKTGTLTEGRMVVEHLWGPEWEATITGTGYRPTGEIRATGPQGDERAVALLRAAALCNDASLQAPAAGTDNWTALGDPTEAALLAAAAKAGLDLAELVVERPRIGELPFDSVRKRMTTVHRTPDGRVEVCLKGAPEAVLKPDVLLDGPDRLDQARRAAARLAADGYRVLAVAAATRDETAAATEAGLHLLGLAALSDPPKPAAAATIRACRRAGITPVLVTGDHPDTARALAARVGLTSPDPDGAADVVTGADLAAGAHPDLTAARVFARTDPQQKLDIIDAWRGHGAVTAMTGDGVNDGPALQQADIGVAMGRRGSEVARQAADLVLADDELATVVSAIEEGRRVYDNIRRFLLYAMSGGAAEILVMLLGPTVGLPLPLRAGQILWINLLTHGLTGVAVGAEPVAARTMSRPPRPPHEHILGAGLWQGVLRLGVLVTALSLAAGVWSEDRGAAWQSVLFLTLLAAQLGVVLGLRERLFTRANPFLPLAVAASAVLGLAALYLPALQDVLGTEPVSWPGLGAAVAAGLVAFGAARFDPTTRRR